jgi:hypothetical protein
MALAEKKTAAMVLPTDPQQAWEMRARREARLAVLKVPPLSLLLQAGASEAVLLLWRQLGPGSVVEHQAATLVGSRWQREPKAQAWLAQWLEQSKTRLPPPRAGRAFVGSPSTIAAAAAVQGGLLRVVVAQSEIVPPDVAVRSAVSAAGVPLRTLMLGRSAQVKALAALTLMVDPAQVPPVRLKPEAKKRRGSPSSCRTKQQVA